MKKIRHSIFETNSSSTHSLSIGETQTQQKFKLNENKDIVIEFYELGWEKNTYSGPLELANCVATWIVNYGGGEQFKMFKEVLKEVPELNRILFNLGGQEPKEYKILKELFEDEKRIQKEAKCFYPCGYLDHQSSDVLEEVFINKDTLENFIFNTNSYYETDNDNQ